MDKVILPYQLDDGQYGYESVWANKIGANYQLENAPFFAKNVSYGDIVSVENENGRLYFLTLVEASEHSTIQVILFTSDAFNQLVSSIEALGGSWEEFDKKQKYLSIDYPPERNYIDLRRILDAGYTQGLWDYKEACLGQNHRNQSKGAV